MDKKESRSKSVSKPGIQCSALNCSGNSENTERFFFSFPPCDLYSKRSIERCRTWVKKAGNIKLLSCLSTSLADNYYLCCSHFPDWTAADSNTRYINSGAVPSYFDCPSLSNAEMEAFPVLEIPAEVTPQLMEHQNTVNTTHEKSAETVPESAKSGVDSSPIKLEIEGTVNTTNSEDIQGQPQEPTVLGAVATSETREIASESADQSTTSVKSLTGSRPSRKAKRNAFDKMSNQQSSKKEDDTPKNSPKSAVGRTFNPRPKKVLKNRYRKIGRSSLGAHEKALRQLISDENGSTIGKNDILVQLDTPGSLPRGSEIFQIRKAPAHKKINETPKPPKAVSILKNPFIEHQMNKSLDYSNPNNGSDCVSPLVSCSGTQTTVSSFETGREMFRILNSDEKLSVLSGIPSFSVLESIADATLSMMMTNRDMINDIEPTMRDWIVMTCTKLMLGISVTALSVLFGFPEAECERIVEKTCFFLRKTLSLPDCQKYVWVLPNQVLNGIAEISDKLTN